MTRCSPILLLLVFLYATSGCGSPDGPKRIPFSGTATLNGESLDAGSISVIPAEGHDGPAANGSIEDGEFSFDRETGPTAGSHTVKIQFIPEKDEWMRMQDAGETPQTVWEFAVDIPDEDSFSRDFKLE